MRDSGRDFFSKQGQSFVREQRMRLVIKKTEKREQVKEKMCQHVNSNGQQCNREKMQKKGAAYCYKHRPK